VVEATGNQLALLSQARQMLAECKSLDEVLDVRDKAAAIQTYLRMRDEGLEAQNHAAEIKLRAERRAGELLAAMPKGNGDPSLHDVSRVPRLADIGIKHIDSHRWQRIASLDERTFEDYIEDSLGSGAELTTQGALRLAKQAANAVRNEAAAGPEAVETLEQLIERGLKFGTVYADPPWQYGNQATRAATDNHYPTMTVDQIATLPVAEVVADNAHLHLWTTNAFLFESKQIMEAWGFTYKSAFVWVKPQMGIGNYWRVSHEFLLLGVRGQCPFADRGLMSWLHAERTRHSAKPEVVRKFVERASPGPRLEMFARVAVQGWTALGNQLESSIFQGGNP
jgi:N6-adenosine-specific RNA methylase IME4